MLLIRCGSRFHLEFQFEWQRSRPPGAQSINVDVAEGAGESGEQGASERFREQGAEGMGVEVGGEAAEVGEMGEVEGVEGDCMRA